MANQDPEISNELLSHQSFLRRLAVDLVGHDADDLVQDVWERALEHPPRDGRAVRSWLARVARNLAANRWRGDSRRTEREERNAREEFDGEDLEARFELRKELIGALDSLEDSSRETILLRYFEGLTPRDIARRQSIPVATVKTRLRRGLNQLHETLDGRHDGDRATWMSAVTALAAPTGNGASTGTLVLGGLVMGTMMKVSAAIIVAVVCVYFATRTQPADSPTVAVVEPRAIAPQPREVELVSPIDDVANEGTQRIPVANDAPDKTAAVTQVNVLRVIIDGLTEEEVSRATVTFIGLNERDNWSDEVRDSMPCPELTREFELDPFLTRLSQHADLNTNELDVVVDHPLCFRETTRVVLSDGVKKKDGKITHEVRVQFVPPEYWPEFQLTVRDVHTRAHLKNVELRFRSTAWMGVPQLPGEGETFTRLATGLNSPIAMLGARDVNEPRGAVAGLALQVAEGETLVPTELHSAGRVLPGRGILIYARAPGYAWAAIVVDVSKGSERELLLESGSGLGVELTNVQLERYAAFNTEIRLYVTQPQPNGGYSFVWYEPLDETLAIDGRKLESLRPGEYDVSVELGDLFSNKKREVLAKEQVTLAAGETQELLLVLADPPALPERATLSGLLSFPTFGGEGDVQLQLYHTDGNPYVGEESRYIGNADVELGLTDMQRVGGSMPTWSFRVDNLPIGTYQLHLKPFLKSWIIEVTAGGTEDVELEIQELAEVLVETIDARTGKRVPIEHFYFRNLEILPGQIHLDRVKANVEEPGLFRFWTIPGAVTYWPRNQSELGYGLDWQELEAVAGFQSVQFELKPIYAMHFEFRDGGIALPVDDHVGVNIARDITAVGHDGVVTGDGLQTTMQVDVSAPGIYEINFDSLDADRYHSIAPRLVEIRAGETTKVIVELQRK